MGYRYLGSKLRIADEILAHVGNGNQQKGYFIDAFCGTGVVAEKAADFGWKIKINDMMKSAVVMSEARLLAKEEVQFRAFGGYEGILEMLNGLPGVEGFMWREYSPASIDFCEYERRYFTKENAKKIDAVTLKVHRMFASGQITHKEWALLISNIITSANDVANIAGTYGCFLSKWNKAAKRSFNIVPSALREARVQYVASNKDVFDVLSEEKDIVYLDPPYTKRQYASYYHIPETIAMGDEPEVKGVSGLRPWKEKASVFCYKAKALKALVRLILKQNARRVLLSYSDEGHIQLKDLEKDLSNHGLVEIVSIGDIGRYRPNKTAVENKASVHEYLVDFKRGE